VVVGLTILEIVELVVGIEVVIVVVEVTVVSGSKLSIGVISI